MTRVVTGADGREWVLRGRLEWQPPVTGNDFEHDVSAGYVPGVVMMTLVVILGAVLIIWTPVDVVVPAWLVLALLLVFLFFPLRWALRRPWTVVAETGEGEETERWVGVVRGILTVRQEISRVADNIATDNMPGFEGPLHPVE
ncbi:hypothetical protein EV193_10518 [Herbihabitans rhizosphaerae]|uniref:DUF983 domain-containing protein n=1 Tax=Herbihabitans rhizosphaerae TaxID=1872711 RepID=A0A4Q7KMD6_9PSEU|nr:DUF983 domain-containing protein [Herbihabitans rhizosphaerae]RZS37464.1 hypothetical protein EV193_10518 [Herbihabitans rhizosphaerae]